MTVPLPKGCLNLTGDKYGKLTVLSFAGRVNGASKWKCRCACGHIGDYFLGNLRGGYSTKCRSCGTAKTHGQSQTRFYHLWASLKTTNRLCSKWASFNKFYKDVTDHPGQFLRRHDLSKPYSPSNSYWGEVQQKPQRPPYGKFYSFDGITLNLNQWSKRLSVSRARIYQLVEKHGSVEAVIRHRANQRGVTMAEVVESFPGGGKEKIYQFEPYTNGDIWKLEIGKDFPGNDIRSFRSGCHGYAKRNNLVVKTRIIDDTIFLQFKPRDEG